MTDVQQKLMITTKKNAIPKRRIFYLEDLFLPETISPTFSSRINYKQNSNDPSTNTWDTSSSTKIGQVTKSKEAYKSWTGKKCSQIKERAKHAVALW